MTETSICASRHPVRADRRSLRGGDRRPAYARSCTNGRVEVQQGPFDLVAHGSLMDLAVSRMASTVRSSCENGGTCASSISLTVAVTADRQGGEDRDGGEAPCNRPQQVLGDGPSLGKGP